MCAPGICQFGGCARHSGDVDGLLQIGIFVVECGKIGAQPVIEPFRFHTNLIGIHRLWRERRVGDGYVGGAVVVAAALVAFRIARIGQE